MQRQQHRSRFERASQLVHMHTCLSIISIAVRPIEQTKVLQAINNTHAVKDVILPFSFNSACCGELAGIEAPCLRGGGGSVSGLHVTRGKRKKKKHERKGRVTSGETEKLPA